MQKTLSKNLTLLIWLSCLAFLSVGLRNFEEGLSIDGPLYGGISREIARSGEWSLLKAGVPDFIPYTEHPHLGFWIQALAFKFLPPLDWAARIPSHLFYLSFLFGFFIVLKHFYSELTATMAVLLLWLWSPFSNFFSNIYLDPSFLVFVFAALFAFWRALAKTSLVWTLLAGVLAACAAMIKGLSVAISVPTFIFVALLWLRQDEGPLKLRPRFLLSFAFILSALLVFSIYAFFVVRSQVPDFFERYWYRQVILRYGGAYSVSKIFDFHFWSRLFKDSYGLLLVPPLALVVTLTKSKNPVESAKRIFLDAKWGLPSLALVSACVLFAPAQRAGGQYNLMMLPWLAWLVAACLNGVPQISNRLSAGGLQHYSKVIALAAVLLLQYFPFRAHARPPSREVALVRELSKAAKIRTLYLYRKDQPFDFTFSSPFAWYADVNVEYHDGRPGTPAPSPDAALLSYEKSDFSRKLIAARGWCLYWSLENSLLYVSCSDQSEGK